MEEAISRFMDGMEAQERGGFNDLHGLLGRLPVAAESVEHNFLFFVDTTTWKIIFPQFSRRTHHLP